MPGTGLYQVKEAGSASETLNRAGTMPEGTCPSAHSRSETCPRCLGPVWWGSLSSKEVQACLGRLVPLEMGTEFEWILLLFLESQANPAV